MTNRNYCLLMDGTKYNRNIACKQHDNAYGENGGGGGRERKKADLELYYHMKENNDPLRLLAYGGVRFYGWLFFNYHKGMHLWSGSLTKRIYSKYFS